MYGFVRNTEHVIDMLNHQKVLFESFARFLLCACLFHGRLCRCGLKMAIDFLVYSTIS